LSGLPDLSCRTHDLYVMPGRGVQDAAKVAPATRVCL
jgi:hypothetical protein